MNNNKTDYSQDSVYIGLKNICLKIVSYCNFKYEDSCQILQAT